MSHEFEALYYVYDYGHRYGPPDIVHAPGTWATRRGRPAIPPLVTLEEVKTKFGDGKIAGAALVILHKAHQQATYDVHVSLRDFEDPTGFLLLLNYGAGSMFGPSYMLRPSSRDPDVFEPTASFWDRLVGQSQEAKKNP